MIARIWQGRTRPKMGDAYYSYLEQTGLKEYHATDGCRGVFVLRQDADERSDYVIVSLWDDLAAVRRFAGADPERAVYYPDDDQYFPPEERRPRVNHYDVVASPLAARG
jgi:heme-degrading monooxygenase HmoA